MPQGGREEGGRREARATRCQGSGLGVGFLTGASLVQLSHLKAAEIASESRYLQTRQEIKKIGKTRNQLNISDKSVAVNLDAARRCSER
jgi:hypothetical protein